MDRTLGVGGMGVVVAATHTALDQKVALKFILPDALRGPESVERFLREAKASVRLKSEHVARVYDVGKLETGDPFIVMELLEGTDLARLSKRHGPMAVKDAVEYVLQACEALIEAHAHGIIHRDLKPQNLFVTRRMNGSPLVKVLDFGIFKATGPAAIGQLSLTDSVTVLGSPLYMAPEQMRAARNADARSDIWSLGVILYELLAGRVPFDGETVTELCLKVTTEPPEPLVKLRDGLPEDLVKLVMRCLEKDAQKRFATVAGLAAALEPFSASAQRGGIDRPWRSLVDTVDQLDLSSSDPGAPPVSGEKAGTGVTWGASSQGLKPQRKRGFAGGLAIGLVLSFAAAGGAYLLASRKAPHEPAIPPAPAAEVVPPAKTADPTPPPAVTTTIAPAMAPSAPAVASAVLAAPPRAPKGRGGRGVAAVPAAPSAPPAPPPPPPEASSAPPAPSAPPRIAPNGAPILK